MRVGLYLLAIPGLLIGVAGIVLSFLPPAELQHCVVSASTSTWVIVRPIMSTVCIVLASLYMALLFRHELARVSRSTSAKAGTPEHSGEPA